MQEIRISPAGGLLEFAADRCEVSHRRSVWPVWDMRELLATPLLEMTGVAWQEPLLSFSGEGWDWSPKVNFRTHFQVYPVFLNLCSSHEADW